MSNLNSTEVQECLICGNSFAMRKAIKTRVSKITKAGKPSCTALKSVMPNNVWVHKILPHYTKDCALLPDLSGYAWLKKLPVVCITSTRQLREMKVYDVANLLDDLKDIRTIWVLDNFIIFVKSFILVIYFVHSLSSFFHFNIIIKYVVD